MRSVTDFRVVEDSGLPTHKPLVIDLNVSAYGQWVRRLALPDRFPTQDIEKWTEEEIEELGQRIMRAQVEAWGKAVVDKDVDRIWALWCDNAEAFLMQRCSLPAPFKKQHCGRGKDRHPRWSFLSAFQSANALGAQGKRTRRWMALCRQLEELQRHLAQHMEGHRPGQHAYQTRRLWSNIADGCTRLQFEFWKPLQSDVLPAMHE
eukprot:12425856-Karenia_brevis.AAC.1